MKKQPFKLPKLTKFETNKIGKEIWLDKISNAQNILTFIKTSDSDYDCLFSGMGQVELGMLLVLFGRYPEVYDFFYTAVVNTELYKNDEIAGFNYTLSLEENLKQNKFI
ncbi:hypothetical protein QWZ08_01965 [Ferruginibacter paludis]|uniref:hypothetical protein n=1 Tax=Ferruginibacter paludis TaxID=1310417 RepID=UPI0025B42084|nr:hypothetical protein [Ferruginibacter paludis]MDN3654372.1 hypothetical protein [Ferruginibacter paludis]